MENEKKQEELTAVPEAPETAETPETPETTAAPADTIETSESAPAEAPEGAGIAPAESLEEDGEEETAAEPLEAADTESPEDPDKQYEIPSVDSLAEEYKRARYQDRYRRTLLNTVFTLITVAASAILVATLWMPVLRIYGNSMEATLYDGDIVATVKTEHMKPGDIVAFYYNNQVLVKRFIAGPGEWVDIDDYGNVFVNNKRLDEPYLLEKSLGECNIELPYQVPDNRIFVLGDHRSISKDSRDKSIGCVDDEQMVGKLVFRVWPLSEFGLLK